MMDHGKHKLASLLQANTNTLDCVIHREELKPINGSLKAHIPKVVMDGQTDFRAASA